MVVVYQWCSSNYAEVIEGGFMWDIIIHADKPL